VPLSGEAASAMPDGIGNSTGINGVKIGSVDIRAYISSRQLNSIA